MLLKLDSWLLWRLIYGFNFYLDIYYGLYFHGLEWYYHWTSLKWNVWSKKLINKINEVLQSSLCAHKHTTILRTGSVDKRCVRQHTCFDVDTVRVMVELAPATAKRGINDCYEDFVMLFFFYYWIWRYFNVCGAWVKQLPS
jgi:hypothetical protein